MCRFPGFLDAGSLAVGKRKGVDGIGVVEVENKEVLIAAAGDDWKFTRLIGV